MRKAVNFRTATFALAGIVSGILYSYFRVVGNGVASVITMIAALTVLAAFIFFSSSAFKSTGKVLCFLFFGFCFLFGALRFIIITDNYDKANLGGNVLTVSGKIDEVYDNEHYLQAVITDVEFKGAVNGKTRYKVAVYVYGENSLRLGDVISFTSAVRNRTVMYNGKFSASALSDGVKYYAEADFSDITLLTQKPNLFQKCNLFIFDALKSGLKETAFPIAYAMLTGNSDFMDAQTLSSYREAGIAHIFAVSGLHIGFLATAVYFLLNRLKVKNVISFLITLSFVGFYSGVCGFSASSVRAVIMFFFLNFAKLFGFKYDGISSVSSAMLFILVFSPVQLFCAGFLLSFSVVFSIIVLYNPLMRLLKFLPRRIAAPLTVSICAELGSVPVSLYFFGAFPSLSFFVNILFIPLAGVLFISLIVGVMLCAIISPAVVLFLPDYAIFGLNYFIRLLDFNIFLVGGFTLGVFSVAYYSAVIVSGGLINLKRITKIITIALLSVTLVVGTGIKTHNEANTVKATVIGDESICAVLLTDKRQSLLIISDLSYKKFSRHRLSEALKNSETDTLSVMLLKQVKEVDLVALTNRLYTVTENFDLYYYGERDETLEKIISGAFYGLTVKNVADGGGLSAFGGRCVLDLDGKRARCIVNDFELNVFAPVLSVAGMDSPEVAPCVIVCADKQDELARIYSPEKTVSFRYKYGYSDGETEGNYTFALKS